MGKQYPVVTYDQPGSDPTHPDNSRFTIGDTRITSGPAQDPRYPGGTFTTVQSGGGKRSEVSGGDYGDDGDDSQQGGGSSCYIATAVLGSPSGGNVDILEPLKAWRYAVMEQSRLGLWMSNLYRRTAPATAKKVAKIPLTRVLLRRVFVDPALQLADEKPSLLRDVRLYGLFVLGTVSAKVLTIGRN